MKPVTLSGEEIKLVWHSLLFHRVNLVTAVLMISHFWVVCLIDQLASDKFLRYSLWC